MSAIRSRLFAFAVALIVCHTSLLIAAPVALCSSGPAEAAAREGVVCTCAHTPGAECPMHKDAKHHQNGSSSKGTRCCSESPDPYRLALTTLTTPMAVPVARLQFGRPDASAAPLAVVVPLLLALDRPPTSPPPRA
jgi:hypothetical protein